MPVPVLTILLLMGAAIASEAELPKSYEEAKVSLEKTLDEAKPEYKLND
jgi:hypothetical protein